MGAQRHQKVHPATGLQQVVVQVSNVPRVRVEACEIRHNQQHPVQRAAAAGNGLLYCLCQLCTGNTRAIPFHNGNLVHNGLTHCR